MRLSLLVAGCAAVVSATIWQNDQIRANPYPGQAPTIATTKSSLSPGWKAYPPSASELSYKGRWDSKYISWWSAPGLVFGFTGNNVAIEFGNYTDAGVLVAYRIDGQDWLFSNVTGGHTYQFVNPTSAGVNLTQPANATQRFELRVTNWSLGVQIKNVYTSLTGALQVIPNFPLSIEIIGDSLSAGQYATYEGISSYSWGLAEGLGDVEFSITAYPGICLHDQRCYGNLRGQDYQYFHTSDTSYRAIQIWGNSPEPWNFTQHQVQDIVVINLGTNDANTAANNVTATQFYDAYIDLIANIHVIYPKAQIILLTLWEGFSPSGNTYVQGGAFIEQIQDVVAHFDNTPQKFVHLFNTTGILQHNDIGPQYHPTDIGHIKLASHLKQYIKDKFDWVFAATGPEVQSHTTYWNDENAY